MKPFILYLTLIASLFTHNLCYAQLTKGTKTLGVNSGLDTYFSNSQSNGSSGKSNAQYLGLGASAGYFLGKNWAVGGSLGLGLAYRKAEGNGTFNQKETRLNTSYNLGATARYYLKNTAKHGIFLFAEATNTGAVYKILETSSTVNNDNTSRNYYTWRTGFGMHQMLSQQLAVEGTLSYGRTYFGDKDVQLTIVPRVFFQSIDKKGMKGEKGTPQYIAQNRWLADGYVTANYNTTTESFYGFAGMTGGKMLTDKWMLGSNIGIGYYTSKKINISAAPFVRYYIPLTNRFYIFPYLGSTLYYYGKKGESNSKIRLDRGVGYHYFLTPNIALSGMIDGDIEHYKNVGTVLGVNSDNAYNNARMSISMGVSYFLK